MDCLTGQEPKVLKPQDPRQASDRNTVVSPSPCGAYLFRASDQPGRTEIIDLEARCSAPWGKELPASGLKTATWTADAHGFLCLLTREGKFDCYHLDI